MTHAFCSRCHFWTWLRAALFGLAACTLLSWVTPAQAVSLNFGGGYGLIGKGGQIVQSATPFAKFELEFGKRLSLILSSGFFFDKIEDVQFSEFTHKREWTGPEAKNFSGAASYFVGAEFRGLILPTKYRNNGYLGIGADWLPQLETYYPGVKLTLGYQVSLSKALQLRIGAEYYIYGVIPFNEANLLSSLVVSF